MRTYFLLVTLVCCLQRSTAGEVRLLDLEPSDAQNLIEQQDQTLKYAPKVESNVPAVRFLGQEPHNVLEDIYLAKQYHGQDGLGGYLYGYQVPDIAKNEQKKPSGDLKGAYNYVNGAGQEIRVQYWDNGNGFHQTDNIPEILPQQIEDLPEVKAAKDAFFKRWQEEAERNTHPVQSPYNSEGQYASGPLSAKGQQQRAQFFAQQPQYQPQQNIFAKAAGPAQKVAGSQPISYYPQQPQYQAAASQQQQVVRPQGLYEAAAAPQPVAQPQHQYLAAASSGQNAYARQPAPQAAEQDNEGAYVPGDEGKYTPQEGEESTGPPKGFFYAFDYPVGIITQDQGRALPAEKSGNFNSVYEQNKLCKQGLNGSCNKEAPEDPPTVNIW
ncbi:uncharacterized protein LOC109538678 isoform X1 [Dendroctonus ponderosae]|uniref:Uncharacterized protein n=1 Tax=Dendroctonus ponderosae TaxID=77166 RepID=U4UAF7_DENPD|nr:uncharacterized protein LOC109538678 isoform X1 [Dendroctonus ponderosae]ERL86935.1 hypothetical protein D910_04338 [Dendroctonus ponderosae]KAH1024628.1 hypothetical protein HUJ05_004088 [Dendroctonus ponderosae]